MVCGSKVFCNMITVIVADSLDRKVPDPKDIMRVSSRWCCKAIFSLVLQGFAGIKATINHIFCSRIENLMDQGIACSVLRTGLPVDRHDHFESLNFEKIITSHQNTRNHQNIWAKTHVFDLELVSAWPPSHWRCILSPTWLIYDSNKLLKVLKAVDNRYVICMHTHLYAYIYMYTYNYTHILYFWYYIHKIYIYTDVLIPAISHRLINT